MVSVPFCTRAELGVRGVVCHHCRLDEMFLTLELRLFSVHTRALTAGQKVTAEEAARQAQAAALRRVGRGGLNEDTAEGGDALQGKLMGAVRGARYLLSSS